MTKLITGQLIAFGADHTQITHETKGAVEGVGVKTRDGVIDHNHAGISAEPDVLERFQEVHEGDSGSFALAQVHGRLTVAGDRVAGLLDLEPQFVASEVRGHLSIEFFGRSPVLADG